MDENDFGAMNDAEFDAVLAHSVEGQAPPDEVVELVSPWHCSVKRVLWGMALMMMNIQLLYLEYILPAVGCFMLIFGLRSLRRESAFFACAYAIAWVRSIYFFSTVMIDASAMRADIYGSELMQALAYVMVALTLGTVFCFVLGFRAVLVRAGREDGTKWLWRLAGWYTVFAAAAIIRVESTLIALLFIACFLLIIFGIARVSRSLSSAGYAITPAGVLVPERQVCALVLGAVALGTALVYIFGAKYPMEWQEKEEARSAEAQEVLLALEELGFPSEILSDLTEEELLACRGAESVIVESGEHALAGRASRVNELLITHVAVNLDSESGRVRLFHHFRLQTEAEYYGTEMFDVIPLYYSDFMKTGEASGRVLYDGKTTFASPYYSMEETGVQGWFSTEVHIRAAFSLPEGGTNKRGYITYEASACGKDIMYENAFVYYTHRTGKLIYPVVGTKDIPSSFFGQDGFKKVTDVFLYQR